LLVGIDEQLRSTAGVGRIIVWNVQVHKRRWIKKF